MYIHLGGDYVVSQEDIIGIFDLENTTLSKHTRQFLNKSEKRSNKRFLRITKIFCADF